MSMKVILHNIPDTNPGKLLNFLIYIQPYLRKATGNVGRLEKTDLGDLKSSGHCCGH